MAETGQRNRGKERRALEAGTPKARAKRLVAPRRAGNPAPRGDAAGVVRTPEAFSAPVDLRTAARDAWIYALPLIESARVRTAAGLLATHTGVGINAFMHRREAAAPAERIFTAPNVDVLFSVAFIDLSNGPATLVLPEAGSRYVSLHLMDMYTNSFAVLGARTIGTQGASVVLAGPRGAAVDGALHAPTDWVWVLVRIAIAGDIDLGAARALQRGFLLRAARARAAGQYAQREAPCDEYFASAAALLAESPPPITDTAVLRRVERLGLWPSKAFHASRFNSAQWAEISAGVEDAKALLADDRPEHPVDGWNYPQAELGNWGENYLYRARAALGGLAALPRREAIYMHAVAPDGSLKFQGGNWRLRFGADGTPPVNAFWSLTAYEVTPDGQYFLAENPLRRYSVGSQTPGLQHNTDGSLDIWIARTDPGGRKSPNWLPAPAHAPFSLQLRAYLPREELLNGSYRLPPLRRA